MASQQPKPQLPDPETRRAPDIPPFVPFDPEKATRGYRRNLPHWRQEGATYFVTCRLADALPAEVLELLRGRQKSWLAARGIEWDQGGAWKRRLDELPDEERQRFRRVFTRAVQRHLDQGYGSCLLRVPAHREKAQNSLGYFHTERFWLGDFVVMPNHLHALMTPLPGYDLEEILGSIKKHSARRINKAAQQTGQSLWQDETYDHIVRDLEELKHFRRYIARNPTEAKLKENEYTYYRATWMNAWTS